MLLISLPAFSNGPFKGFVEIEKGRQLYVDHIPARPGQPTLVIINGLTYDTKSWDPLMPHILNKGYGILRYDPMGMGETLVKSGYPTKNILIDDQARDLKLLLENLKLNKVSILGLSYGGALAIKFATLFPKKVDKLILKAPYVKPLEGQDKLIKAQIEMTRALFPLNPASYDQLYDYFLKIHVYSTYPLAEPIAISNATKLEAIYRMVAGVRKFNTLEVLNQLPKESVHLMVAGMDQYIPAIEHEYMWEGLTKEQRQSRVYVLGAEHKIPESAAFFAGHWVNQIMRNNPKISKGRTFIGNSYLGIATCGSIILRVNKY